MKSMLVVEVDMLLRVFGARKDEKSEKRQPPSED